MVSFLRVVLEFPSSRKRLARTLAEWYELTESTQKSKVIKFLSKFYLIFPSGSEIRASNNTLVILHICWAVFAFRGIQKLPILSQAYFDKLSLYFFSNCSCDPYLNWLSFTIQRSAVRVHPIFRLVAIIVSKLFESDPRSCDFYFFAILLQR